MDDRDYKAFIVEGEFREPQVIDNISKRFFNHGNCKLIPLPAGENIYMLWKKLEADDFETDIIEVLRESSKELQKLLEGLSREDFSEVFLFFDYDAHQTNLGNADGQDRWDSSDSSLRFQRPASFVRVLPVYHEWISGKVHISESM